MGFITEPNRGNYLFKLRRRSKTSNDVIDEIRAKVEASQPAFYESILAKCGIMLG
jgi:hypothetical protein